MARASHLVAEIGVVPLCHRDAIIFSGLLFRALRHAPNASTTSLKIVRWPRALAEKEYNEDFLKALTDEVDQSGG